MPDWIESFMAYTDGLPTSSIFRLWSGITAVSAAMERRCWANVAHSDLYANLYTLLVGSPGTGKSQAISPVSKLWYSTKKLFVAPDNMTAAALVDALEEADRKLTSPEGLVQYHSLAIAAGELGVLIPAHDLAFLSILNHLYDNPLTYREKRRTLNKESDIINPQLTFLAGTQPGFMASLFPEEAWSMGFTSRIIMVYSSEIPQVELFGGTRPSPEVFKSLTGHLADITSLRGQFLFSEAASTAITQWHKGGHLPVPDHSKLEHYNSRRILHLLKLSMISAVSRSMELIITHEDVDRALDWLLSTERFMPDVFRQMVGRSDTQVLQELHIFAHRIWAKEHKPLHESRLIHFLSTQVPADKVQRILETADRANILNRVAGTATYLPRPRNEHGVE